MNYKGFLIHNNEVFLYSNVQATTLINQRFHLIFIL